MRVRATRPIQPERSSAELDEIGVATASAPRRRAASRPTRSPRRKAPVSSAISGRSPSPSVETSASRPCSATQKRACASSSTDTASVSTGTNASVRPSGTTAAPSAASVSTSRSRPVALCCHTPILRPASASGVTKAMARLAYRMRAASPPSSAPPAGTGVSADNTASAAATPASSALVISPSAR